jgi:peptidoglycan/LPS O-acetylase OafA/YrhL
MTSATPTERSAAVHGRILQLDGLRAVAIMLVLVNHTFRLPLTWAGVDVFFVLSGFLITGILLSRKKHPKTYFAYFYRRRIFRILPSYYVTLLIFGLIFGWVEFHPWPTLVFFGMNLQPFFTKYPIPLPLWSLAVEEQFYLVFPVIVLLCSERTLKRLLWAALVLTPALRALCKPLIHSEIYMYILTPFRADLLCAGALLAMVWRDRSPGLEAFCREKARYVLVGTLFLLGLSQHWWMFVLWSQSRVAYVWVFSATLICSVALVSWTLADRGWLHRILTWRPVRYIGEISYTMYLVHFIFVMLMSGHHVRNRWVLFVSATAGSIVWASISWFVMERPLIRYAARSTQHLTEKQA